MNANQTILVIIRNRITREAVCSVLELEGYTVRTAESGAVGLADIGAHPPHLILLSNDLDDIDSSDLYAQLHVRDAQRAIPVLFIIIRPSWDCFPPNKLSIDDYIVPPFTVDELITSIEHRLRSYFKPCEIADQNDDVSE